jgi:hypothetical protein
VELCQEEDYQPDEDEEVDDLSVSPLGAKSAVCMRAWLKFKLQNLFAPQLDFLSILDSVPFTLAQTSNPSTSGSFQAFSPHAAKFLPLSAAVLLV